MRVSFILRIRPKLLLFLLLKMLRFWGPMYVNFANLWNIVDMSLLFCGLELILFSITFIIFIP
jgi:hypothetical protein